MSLNMKLSEQLFLIEILVHKVHLRKDIICQKQCRCPKARFPALGEPPAERVLDEEEEDIDYLPLRVRVKFINFPCVEINQKEFAGSEAAEPKNEEEKQKRKKDPGHFGTGKSFLFPMSPYDLIRGLNHYPLAVAVTFSESEEDQSKISVLGVTQVSLALEEVCNTVRRVNECEQILPISSTVKDAYDLVNLDGEYVGYIVMLIRLSCFGQSIVTQFQLTEERSYLFRNTRPDEPFPCDKCEDHLQYDPATYDLLPAAPLTSTDADLMELPCCEAARGGVFMERKYIQWRKIDCDCEEQPMEMDTGFLSRLSETYAEVMANKLPCSCCGRNPLSRPDPRLPLPDEEQPPIEEAPPLVWSEMMPLSGPPGTVAPHPRKTAAPVGTVLPVGTIPVGHATPSGLSPRAAAVAKIGYVRTPGYTASEYMTEVGSVMPKLQPAPGAAPEPSPPYQVQSTPVGYVPYNPNSMPKPAAPPPPPAPYQGEMLGAWPGMTTTGFSKCNHPPCWDVMRLSGGAGRPGGDGASTSKTLMGSKSKPDVSTSQQNLRGSMREAGRSPRREGSRERSPGGESRRSKTGTPRPPGQQNQGDQQRSRTQLQGGQPPEGRGRESRRTGKGLGPDRTPERSGDRRGGDFRGGDARSERTKSSDRSDPRSSGPWSDRSSDRRSGDSRRGGAGDRRDPRGDNYGHRGWDDRRDQKGYDRYDQRGNDRRNDRRDDRRDRWDDRRDHSGRSDHGDRWGRDQRDAARYGMDDMMGDYGARRRSPGGRMDYDDHRYLRRGEAGPIAGPGIIFEEGSVLGPPPSELERRKKKNYMNPFWQEEKTYPRKRELEEQMSKQARMSVMQPSDSTEWKPDPYPRFEKTPEERSASASHTSGTRYGAFRSRMYPSKRPVDPWAPGGPWGPDGPWGARSRQPRRRSKNPPVRYDTTGILTSAFERDYAKDEAARKLLRPRTVKGTLSRHKKRDMPPIRYDTTSCLSGAYEAPKPKRTPSPDSPEGTWRPGAICNSLKDRVKAPQRAVRPFGQALRPRRLSAEHLCLDEGKIDEDQFEPKPTLHIHRYQGDFFVSMHPDDLAGENVPLQFRIINKEKKPVTCQDSDSELEIELFQPGAFYTVPKAELSDMKTQCDEQYLVENYQPPPKVIVATELPKPPKPPKKGKKKGKKGKKGKKKKKK